MFNYQEFWEKYDWNPLHTPPEDFLQKAKKYFQGKTVLDIGCGAGRWLPLFEGMDYTGVDISEREIDAAKKRYPGKNFICADITEWEPTKKYDLIFTSTALQHIVPEKIHRFSQKLQKWGKRLVMVEGMPTGTLLAPYMFSYDYEKLFPVTHKQLLEGSTYVLVADLEKPAGALISVIMPTFNRAHTLADAIDSVLNQTYKNFEFIIVDDGSTDTTPELIRYYLDQDERIKYFQTPNQGIARARNFGIRKATGEYIAVMDSDDWMLPQRLEKSLKEIVGYDGVFSSFVQADDLAKPFGMVEPKPFNRITVEGIIKFQEVPHVTIMAKRQCFLEYPYRPHLRVNDDHALILDWYVYGKYKLKKIKLPLMAVRYHGGSTSQQKDEEIKKTIKDLREEFLSTPAVGQTN
jgi:trans-aconitate methyltransferase